MTRKQAATEVAQEVESLKAALQTLRDENALLQQRIASLLQAADEMKYREVHPIPQPQPVSGPAAARKAAALAAAMKRYGADWKPRK